tara:strand:- start:2053 stop:2475 length:423 start_codon:yes stop_codon:yes gene_type:complete
MDFKNINNYLNFKQKNSNNNNHLENTPNLIEPGVKYFFTNTLKSCNNYKLRNYNIFYNITCLIIFISILGIILIYKLKNKRTTNIYEKNRKDKEYIMSKLIYYNRVNLENKKRENNQMITNLPDFNNHPEASLLHRKIYF